MSFFSTKWLLSISRGQMQMKLTAVHVSIPQLIFSSTSFPKIRLYFIDICLFRHCFGSHPHPSPHSTFVFAQLHSLSITRPLFFNSVELFSGGSTVQHSPVHLLVFVVNIISLILSASRFYLSVIGGASSPSLNPGT